MSGVSWIEHDWGTVPVNDIGAGASAQGTTFVRSVRDDGSVAGLNDPGSYDPEPVSTGALVSIWGDVTGRVTALRADGTTFVSAVNTA
jgi:hypothetical protein